MGAKQMKRRRCDLPFVIAIAALKIASFGPGQTQSWSTLVGMSKFFARSLQQAVDAQSMLKLLRPGDRGQGNFCRPVHTHSEIACSSSGSPCAGL